MPAYPISFSPVQPSSERLRLVTRQSVTASPYSGRTAIVNNYASWTLDLNFSRMSETKAMAHTAWLDSLAGSKGTFLYTPRSGIRAVAAALTLAVPAYPAGTIAQLAGYTANAATGLKVGQFISIGDQLLRLSVAAATADAQGRALVEFNPPLRSQRLAGTAVETAAPRGVFRLMQGETGTGYQWDADRAPEFETLVAVEAL